jgi:hypothetical protein
MKFVAPLAEAERLTLCEARDYSPTAALRRRAQTVELSSRGYRLNTIAALLERHRETVSGWLDLWASQGLRGLYDLPRCGRPPVFTPLEAEQVRAEVVCLRLACLTAKKLRLNPNRSGRSITPPYFFEPMRAALPMKTPPEDVKLSREDGEALIARIRANSLADDDQGLLIRRFCCINF